MAPVATLEWGIILLNVLSVFFPRTVLSNNPFGDCQQLETGTWCFGSKNSDEPSSPGKGCFFLENCETFLVAKLKSGDRIEWTLYGKARDANTFVSFFLSHETSDSWDQLPKNTVIAKCQYNRDSPKASVLVNRTLQPDINGHFLGILGLNSANYPNAFLINGNAYVEDIKHVTYFVCKFVSKKKIVFPEKGKPEYVVDLDFSEVYPHLIQWDEGRNGYEATNAVALRSRLKLFEHHVSPNLAVVVPLALGFMLVIIASAVCCLCRARTGHYSDLCCCLFDCNDCCVCESLGCDEGSSANNASSQSSDCGCASGGD